MPAKRRAPSNEVEDRPSQPIDPAALYTYPEAAAHLRMSERAVSKLVHAKVGSPTLDERS